MQIDDLAGKLRGIEAGDKNLASTEALLQRLGRRVGEPISWNIKRQLIEIFVGGIQVDTLEATGKKVKHRYRHLPVYRPLGQLVAGTEAAPQKRSRRDSPAA